MSILRKFTQTLGVARLNYPPRRILSKSSQLTNQVDGFGTVDNNSLSTAIPGYKKYVSQLRVPPAFNRGPTGQKVVPAPGTGYTQQLIKKQTISLASTFTDIPYIMSGTILWYITSTNATDAISVRIGDINADPLPWGPGNGIEGLSFDRIFVSNATAVAGAIATLVYFSDTPNAPARFF